MSMLQNDRLILQSQKFLHSIFRVLRKNFWDCNTHSISYVYFISACRTYLTKAGISSASTYETINTNKLSVNICDNRQLLTESVALKVIEVYPAFANSARMSSMTFL